MSLGVLADMITPAVLLSGCAALILSTSNRLGRASDRVRRLSERVRALAASPAADDEAREEWSLIERLMPQLIRRVRSIHRSLIALYLAVELFVLTSLAVGASGALAIDLGHLPVGLGLAGVVTLSYAAALLTVEARLSLSTNLAEMEAIRQHALRCAAQRARSDVPAGTGA